MKNIEIKVRCADLDTVRQRLAGSGVALDQRMRQVDTYFNAPHGRLKLREINGVHAELIHYHRADVATARESDYGVAPVVEPLLLKQLLTRALGVRNVVVKERELYLWGHTRIHLDQVADLGSFVELETVVKTQSLEAAAAECLAVQAALGISDTDAVCGSYADLLTAISNRIP